MNDMTWDLLAEVQGRFEAEALKAFLEAQGVPTQLIQEGLGEFVYAVTVGALGRVQVFVPKDKLDEARLLHKAFYTSDSDVELADDETNEPPESGA